MNLTHAHLLLNHFPTVGMVVGLALFILALISKSDDIKRASLALFVVIALLALPTFATGTAAQLALSATKGVSQTMIAIHLAAAFLALCFLELAGALSWIGLWQYRRHGRISSSILIGVLIVGLISFGLMSRAASIGGEIRHPEIATGPPPVEQEEPPPSFAQSAGAILAGYQWAWAASETLHFVGLCLIFGVTLIVDLRMLGLMRAIPFATIHRLLPWGMLGFALNVSTGMLFFIGAPPSFYVTNSVYFWKLAFVMVAGLNTLYFTVVDEPYSVEAGADAPLGAKIAAASGIALWTAVIFCGQMLPFLGRSY